MSLLDRGTTVLDIYPEVTSTDDLGNTIVGPAEEPIRVRLAMQPVTAEELSALGQDLFTTYRVIGRTAPLGAWVRVRRVSDGTWWDVVGRPRQYTMSRRTAHVDAILSERKDPPTPGEARFRLVGGRVVGPIEEAP